MYDELKEGVSHLVRIQRDLLQPPRHRSAQNVLESLGLLEEPRNAAQTLQRRRREERRSLRKLWLVSKGTPRNKIFKRLKENPDLRAEIDKWETYYFGEQNKEEKFETLAELYMIVDERNNEYELTDKGIQHWGEFTEGGEAPMISSCSISAMNTPPSIRTPLFPTKKRCRRKIAPARRRCQTKRALPQSAPDAPRPSSDGKRYRLHRPRQTKSSSSMKIQAVLSQAAAFPTDCTKRSKRKKTSPSKEKRKPTRRSPSKTISACTKSSPA